MRHLSSTLALGLLLAARPAMSQERESRPFAERFLYGGEITGNWSPVDYGYFNELDYQRNLLRLVRINFALEFQASERVSVLTEIRSDNLDAPEAYALYLRFRPWRERGLDVQVGRIPPVFGAFARRRYDVDNPLIGYPLLYQYPSTVRPDAAPSEISQVLRQRGWGVVTRYPLGDPAMRAGLPTVNPLKWDTGVEVKLGSDPLELAVALTQGTISSPRVRDDNDGKQVAARLGWRPRFEWTIGISAARGAYLAEDVAATDAHQTALGLDVEYGRGHLLLRAETIWSQWETPTLRTGALGSLGFLVEARYKLSPGLYVAGRVDRLSFENVAAAGGTVGWDAPITRLEVGVGYYLHRHVLAKVAYQYNERDAGPRTARGVPALQLLFWF